MVNSYVESKTIFIEVIRHMK